MNNDAMNREEIELLANYRAADRRGKQSIRDHAKDTAAAWPESRRAKLSVVAALGSGTPSLAPGSGDSHQLATLVRTAV